LEVSIDKTTEQWTSRRSDYPIEVLRSAAFQREHPFAVMDFLSAHRQSQPSVAPSVNLGILTNRQNQEQRSQLIHQYVDYGPEMALPDIGSYLLTLDYQNYLTTRQQLDIVDDFDVIATAFESATGKRILKPQFDVEKGESSIQVQIPAGALHGLDSLSSGEQAMLTLMYFVRRLSATGGILLVDEPEKHLHPSLQAGLVRTTSDLAERAQIIFVTHSVNLISVAEPAQMLEMTAPTAQSQNQLLRLQDRKERLSLLEALGIVPADLAQNDFVLVVEGERDAQWIRSLFPVETARAHIMSAGSGKQVLEACRVLSKTEDQLPWVAVMDRDLNSDEEIRRHQDTFSNLFVWSRREFENVLIDPQLIAEALKRIGRVFSVGQIESTASQIAANMEADVVETMTLNALNRQIPTPKPPGSLDRNSKAKERLSLLGETLARRSADFDSTASLVKGELQLTWHERWPRLIDGKAFLAAFRAELEIFGSVDEFATTLVATARDVPEVRPSDIVVLGEKILAAVTPTEKN
jgi:hypothetical protein